MALIDISKAGKDAVDEAAKVLVPSLNLDQVAKDAIDQLHLTDTVKAAVDELHLDGLLKSFTAELDPISKARVAEMLAGLRTLLIGRTITIKIM